MLDPTYNAVDEKLFPELNTRRNLTVSEHRRLIHNSMLAGVISRGPKLTSKIVIQRDRKSTGAASAKNIFEINPLEKAFPTDRIVDLIDAARSYRDKTYLSYLAASGVRGSEARQTLWQDIDPLERTVRVAPPWGRRFTSLWDAIPSGKQEDIAWKGRETELTFLLEPFKTLFFDNLERYRNTPKEWDRTIDHPFVFIKERRYSYEPLLLASPSSISEIFTKPMKRLKGLLHNHYGAHSLRHSYGLYLANKIPMGNGVEGMRIEYVRDLMGHALITSTQIYAPTDRVKIMEQFKRANDLILGNLVNMQMLSANIEKYRLAIPEEERRKLQSIVNEQGELDAD
jgi:integrase